MLIHLLLKWIDHSLTLSGVRINARSAEERRKSFDESVTARAFPCENSYTVT